jgi:AbrB family looped-hinge helix DNA binding protein
MEILMETAAVETTRLSTKGQVVLPKTIRASRAWGPGTEFTVEVTGDGILLRPASRFSEADLDQVAGCLGSDGKSQTPAQMRAAVGREVMRRHDRGRY